MNKNYGIVVTSQETENSAIVFEWKKPENLTAKAYQTLRDSVRTVFPDPETEAETVEVAPEDVSEVKTMSMNYTNLEKLFLDIGNQCLYMQENGVYVTYMHHSNILYVKGHFVFLSTDVDEVSDTPTEWMKWLSDIVVSYIELNKLIGTPLYYAIQRCRNDGKFIFI